MELINAGHGGGLASPLLVKTWSSLSNRHITPSYSVTLWVHLAAPTFSLQQLLHSLHFIPAGFCPRIQPNSGSSFSVSSSGFETSSFQLISLAICSDGQRTGRLPLSLRPGLLVSLQQLLPLLCHHLSKLDLCNAEDWSAVLWVILRTCLEECEFMFSRLSGGKRAGPGPGSGSS